MAQAIQLLQMHLTMAHAAVGSGAVKPDKINRPSVGMKNTG
jgi:hypothetical protein